MGASKACLLYTSAHRSLGTFPQGTIRFSLGFANTEQDVDAAVAALRAISAD